MVDLQCFEYKYSGKARSKIMVAFFSPFMVIFDLLSVLIGFIAPSLMAGWNEVIAET